MQQNLDLYFIATRRNRYILFGSENEIELCEAKSGDRIRKSIDWVMTRQNRVVAWVGRVLNAGHGYYVKLEDRLDPAERVLKAMGSSASLTVYHSTRVDESTAQSRFRSLLRKQRIKHSFWLSIDSVFTLVVIALTPILAPIPGPNVFFYFPALRLLSHWAAIRGTASALGSVPIQFKSLPDLSGLEENLQTESVDRSLIHNLMERLQIRGLDRFLERMV